MTESVITPRVLATLLLDIRHRLVLQIGINMIRVSSCLRISFFQTHIYLRQAENGRK